MKVEVFDDVHSLVHLALGALSVFFPAVFFIFVAYEIVEFIWKHRTRSEKLSCFFGDFFEYTFGSSIAFSTLAYLYP